MKKIFVLVFALFSINTINASNEIKPIRIGLNIGWPYMLGFGTEYVTPLLDNRVAPFINYSFIGGIASDASSNSTSKGGVRFFEIGTNIYAQNNGKNAYLGLSYGNLAVIGTSSSGGSSSTGKISMPMFNFKVGAKLGHAFYFRPEIGYSIVTNVKVEGVSSSNGTEVAGLVKVNDLNGMLLLNLGLGFAF